MSKTVKELIIKIKQEIKLCNSVLSLRTLEDLINKYEKKLVEKDKVIELMNEQCDGAIKEFGHIKKRRILKNWIKIIGYFI